MASDFRATTDRVLQRRDSQYQAEGTVAVLCQGLILGLIQSGPTLRGGILDTEGRATIKER